MQDNPVNILLRNFENNVAHSELVFSACLQVLKAQHIQ